MAAADLIDRYVGGLPGRTRRPGACEWGITLRPEHAGGHPLDIGLSLSGGLVRAKAFAVPADPRLDPWLLLHWNRQTRFVRFGATRAGDVWVHADIAAGAVTDESLDRLLGLVVEGAVAAREYAAAAMRAA